MIGGNLSKVWLSSLLATALVVTVDLSGGFDGLHERLLDLEQQWLPRDVAPMSEDIVLVDIDDRALERLGRWPWPRSALAGAVEELHRAGARTIAIDLDLADPQDHEWDPGPPPLEIDHDAALAEAISPRVVLGALRMPDELPARWADAGGSPEGLAQTLDAMRRDPTLDPRTTPILTNRSRTAASQTLHLLRRRTLFERSSDPGASASTDLIPGTAAYEAVRPIAEAADRQRAARESMPGVLPHPDDQSTLEPPSAGDRFALPAFTEASGGTGYVNIVRRSHDGGIRHLVPFQPVGHGGVIPSLGLAAVANYLDAPPLELVDQETLLVGDQKVPLADGAMTICWPRSPIGMRWPDLHRESESDERFTGHLSIAEVVLLARQREIMEQNLLVRHDASRDILRGLRQTPDLEVDDWLDPELQSEIAEEAAFDIGHITSRDELAEELNSVPPDERGRLERMFNWREATRLAAEIETAVQEVEASLQQRVNDRLVMIGWTATGTLADFVPTAAGPRTPGVMVHAATADMILQRRVLNEGFVAWSAILGAIFGLLIACIVSLMGPWPATASAIGIAALWCGCVVLIFAQGTVLPAATPLIAIGASWAAGTGGRAVLNQREKRRIARQFRARVPAALVDELARDPDALSMLGVRREVCVMFGDLAGFTGISEELDTEQTVSLLNRCMAGLTEEVTSHGAYLNKFLGDGFLAFWSAFHEQKDQAAEACKAALACHEVMRRINNDPALGGISLGLRIGIATGEALVGDCGAPPRLNDYTVIGDVANLASRLESANKQIGTSILLDGRTHRLADSAELPFFEIGPLQVVGREGVVDVWTLERRDAEDADLASRLAGAVRAGNRAEVQSCLEQIERRSGSSIRTRLIAEMMGDSRHPMPRAIRLQEK